MLGQAWDNLDEGNTHIGDKTNYFQYLYFNIKNHQAITSAIFSHVISKNRNVNLHYQKLNKNYALQGVGFQWLFAGMTGNKIKILKNVSNLFLCENEKNVFWYWLFLNF